MSENEAGRSESSSLTNLSDYESKSVEKVMGAFLSINTDQLLVRFDLMNSAVKRSLHWIVISNLFVLTIPEGKPASLLVCLDFHHRLLDLKTNSDR